MFVSSTHINATLWDGVETQIENMAQVHQAQLAAHVSQNHDQQSRNIGPGVLSRFAWDYEYELFVGNDIVDGDAYFQEPVKGLRPAVQQQVLWPLGYQRRARASLQGGDAGAGSQNDR